jgi:hypothetical protein
MQLGTWFKKSKTKDQTEKKTHEVVSESIILLLSDVWGNAYTFWTFCL